MDAYTEMVGSQTSSVTRQFNDANQLVVSLDPELGTTSFSYDDNGNLTRILPPGVSVGEAGEQAYDFNQRNLLTRFQTGAGNGLFDEVATYRYDGDDNRVQLLDGSGTTTFTNDNAGLSQVLLRNDGTTQTQMLFGLDLIHQSDGATTRTMLADGLGSVRTELVGSSVETTTTYEPYGKLLAQTGSSGTTYGYTGEQFDAVTSLTYLRARYYNPELKLFVSRDPIGGWLNRPASQHGYSYAHNNPVNHVDPTGHCVFFGIDTLICLGAGAGFLTSMGVQTYGNIRDGMPFLEAIYHENIDWTQVGAGTAAGAIGGAIAPFMPAGAGLGGAVGYGALDGFIGGVTEQFLLNQFLECREWYDDLLATGFSGAVGGGLTGGLFHGSGRTASGIFSSLEHNRFVPNRLFPDHRANLLRKLEQNGTKHSAKDIVRIKELSNGQIVFLETGSSSAGLQHILEAHAEDFARQGISENQVPDFIMNALEQNKVIGYQGKGKRKRPIYEVNFHGNTYNVAISTSTNGFIVGANPVSKRKFG